MHELQKWDSVKGNFSSWSSGVAGANEQEPSGGNEVGGGADGETRIKKHMGQLRDHLIGFQRNGKRQLRKHEDFGKRTG